MKNNIKLVAGEGDGETTACVMSLASLLANEPFSDAPKCVSTVIRRLCIILNDSPWWKDDAERTRKLWPLAHRILGSKSTPEVEAKRARECVLTAARVFVPAALRTVKREDLARKLEAIPDDATYVAIRATSLDVADAAYDAAHAAAYAAADADAYAAAAAYAYADAYADAAAHAAHAAAHAAARVTSSAKLPMRRALKDLILRCLEIE